MPRILHVIAALERGGAERQMQLICNGLASEGVEVGVMFVDGGVADHRLIESVRLFDLGPAYAHGWFALAREVARTIAYWRPDVAHLWMPEVLTIPAAIACLALRIPVLSAQRRSLRKGGNWRRFLRDRLVYVQHTLARKIVTNYPVSSEPLLFRWIFGSKGGEVILNGVQVHRAAVHESQSTLPEYRHGHTLWYTGRFAPQKRLPLLLRAVRELRSACGLDARLVICGSGSPAERSGLEGLARSLGLNGHVLFLGYRSDWHAMITDRDVFVLPSISEGMPNVLLEVMQLGVPVIATKIPEIEAIARHRVTAYLVEPDNLQSLVHGIREVVESTTMAARISKDAMDFANQYSVDTMVTAYIRTYLEIVGTRFDKKL